MCGIAGIYNFRSGEPVYHPALEAMTRTMTHRGPDDEGYFYSPDVLCRVHSSREPNAGQGILGLGHRRLSILDLSPRGRQPMTTSEGRFTIAYNGEIYNYVELRSDLTARGHVFRTNTDTEVLLQLFASEGIDCLKRLNGMFAFAIWDSWERALWVVRDRIGIKPLYYAETLDGFVFGSEAKALFSSKQLTAEVETSSIDSYLSVGYVPGPTTMFRGVRKLEPAHWLKVGPHTVQCGQYWQLSYNANESRSSQTTVHEFSELLRDAVRLRLRSDVPLGVFLSGGLDSSAVVALLSEAVSQGLKTFSVAYRGGKNYDETPYAKLVADRFRTDHEVLYVESGSFREFIPDYVWFMDEPVADAAALSLYFVARLLKKKVTVALSGEGADELFAGYDIYRYMHWIETFRRLPAGFRSRFLEPILTAICSGNASKYMRLASKPLEQRYLGVSLYDRFWATQLYAPGFANELEQNPPGSGFPGAYAETQGKDVLTRMLYTDLKTWLVDDLLIKADKMTMANAVELRVPFLDHRVVEYAATIPSRMKLRNGVKKWILKACMKHHLPPEILRRRKVGFPTPLELMFRRDLSGYVRDVLLSKVCLDRGYFRRAVVEKLVDEHIAGQADHHRLLWQLIVLEEWHRRFIDMGPYSRVDGDLPANVPQGFAGDSA